jgi:hypothetical protein
MIRDIIPVLMGIRPALKKMFNRKALGETFTDVQK